MKIGYLIISVWCKWRMKTMKLFSRANEEWKLWNYSAKKRKNKENFQLGRVIHMADKASSTGILKPELHVTVQEQLYMQSGDVAVTQPLSM